VGDVCDVVKGWWCNNFGKRFGEVMNIIIFAPRLRKEVAIEGLKSSLW
jgi:hypothetical protein